MVYDFVTNIYTRPELGEHILVGGLDAEESHDLVDPDAFREGVSVDESTEALARVSHRFPVLADGRIVRAYAGCFGVTPDWHPILDRVGPEGYIVAAGFSGHGFKLSPAVGSTLATLVLDGASRHPDLPTFRLSRFAEGSSRPGPRHISVWAQDVRDHGRLGDAGDDSGSDTSHAQDRADLAGGGQDRVLEGSADGVSAKTRLERKFAPEAIRELKADATRDVAVGGPVLAAHAIRADLVDEYQVFVAPIIVGSGHPYLPDKVRVNLELIDERGFDNGMVHVRYRAKS